MASDADYARAAQAVNSGTADKAQRDLNDKMARNARAGSTLAQNAQDAKKGKLK